MALSCLWNHCLRRVADLAFMPMGANPKVALETAHAFQMRILRGRLKSRRERTALRIFADLLPASASLRKVVR